MDVLYLNLFEYRLKMKMSDKSQTSDQDIPNTPLKNFNTRCPTN